MLAAAALASLLARPTDPRAAVPHTSPPETHGASSLLAAPSADPRSQYLAAPLSDVLAPAATARAQYDLQLSELAGRLDVEGHTVLFFNQRAFY